MNLTVYTFIFYLFVPFLLIRLWIRGRKVPAYRERWKERLGICETASTVNPLWIHAVSVGETLAIAPLVKMILARHPDIPIVMTTMTPTGAERVKEAFKGAVTHIYCPYDLPCALDRFLSKINPRACVIVETELWPNLVKSCSDKDIPILVANARLSERSAKGYARFGKIAEQMFKRITTMAVQNETDGQRFLDLGLPKSAMEITGSIKFDVSAPEGSERLALALRQLWGESRPVLIGASTHEGEETALLNLYQSLQRQHPRLILILVPRHPERFDSVAEQVKKNGFKLVRRSLGQQPDEKTQVYLGDTMGELMKLLASADIAFVGGSIIERGGHNPLEPAVLGKPVIMGPHFFNFQPICESLQNEGGLSVVTSQQELVSAVVDMLDSPEKARFQGGKAREFVKQNQGALERLYALTEEVCLKSSALKEQ